MATLIGVALAGCSASPPAASLPAASPPAALPPAAGPAASASASPPVPADAPPAEATPPPAARRPATKTLAPEPQLDRFVAAVQRQLPQFAMDRREEEVAAIGEVACASRASGKRTAAVVAEIEDAGVTKAEARKLLTLAEDTAC
ncbi:MAG: hypothetical protein ABW022_16865 [Actinoplanes sp.]